MSDITVQVSAGSIILQGTNLVPSLAAAQSSESLLQGNATTLSASLGVQITAVSGVGTSAQVFRAP
jgi:hypothetical protein